MSGSAVTAKKARPSDSSPGGDSSGDAFVCAFNDCRRELVSTLSYVLGNADDAHDVAQEAFLKCWRTRAAWPDVRNLRAWIFRVGMNAAKDLQRNAWRRKVRPTGDLPLPEPAAGPSPIDQLEDREEQTRLRTALTELRPDEQEVFLLRQNGDLTFEEIAEQRQVPVGTVKTQMRTALQKLRRALQETEAR